jgi:hypothetical protein
MVTMTNDQKKKKPRKKKKSVMNPHHPQYIPVEVLVRPAQPQRPGPVYNTPVSPLVAGQYQPHFQNTPFQQQQQQQQQVLPQRVNIQAGPARLPSKPVPYQHNNIPSPQLVQNNVQVHWFYKILVNKKI